MNEVDVQEGELQRQTNTPRDNFSWQLGIDEVSRETTNEDDIRTAHDENELTCLTDCQNAIGLCSWLDRIWTRQEFSYSSHINIVWNSTVENSCTNVGFRETRDLAINPFYQLVTSNIRRQLSECSPYPSNDDLDLAADLKLSDMAYDFLTTGRAAVDQYTQTDDPGLLFAEFLLGKPLESKHTFEDPLERFFLDLRNLATSTRTATKPRDLVLAIWCDCPGYIIPTDYRNAKPFDLLEDAIKQLERNHSITPLTTCPSGLFGDSGPSVSWRSLAVSQSSVLASAKDMYAVFTMSPDESIIPLLEGAVPLRMVLEPPGSIGRRAGYYESVCGDWSTVQALCIMGRAIDNFDERLSSLLTPRDSANFATEVKATELSSSLRADHQESASPRDFDQCFLDENADALAFHFEAVLSWNRGESAQDVNMAEEWEVYRELDHHSLIYKIVARILNLDYDVCRSHGLRLMITLDDPVRIGLIRGHHHTQSPDAGDGRADLDVADNAMLAARAGLADTMTVWNFETERISDDEAGQPPKYRVVGIWVPCPVLLRDEVGAVPTIDMAEVDAWLV